jgi:hypothetical protein
MEFTVKYIRKSGAEAPQALIALKACKAFNAFKKDM